MSYVDDFFSEQQNAREAVVGLEDDNPEQAARAIEISRITGVPSLAVATDLPAFERQAKNEMATAIIKDNPALQEYINSNPMAPRISSDDWGNLDGIVKKVAGISAAVNSTLSKTVWAYAEGMQEQGHIGSWLYNTPEKAEFTQKMIDDYGPLARTSLMLYTAAGLPIEALSRVLGPVPGAAKTFVTNAYGHATGDFNTAERLGREVAGFVEYVFNKPPGTHVGPLATVLHNAELRRLADVTGPHLRAGQEPPIGLHPALDELKKEQTKRDLKELDELTSEVQQSTTRARSPEMFADLLRRQTDANIYIPFDGVVKLYGEKPIKPDDGVLGWVLNIQEQVRTMSMTGGDIVIPLADWLAKSDKAVAKDLHDNIRVRRGGFTIEEAKNYEAIKPEQVVEEPLTEPKADVASEVVEPLSKEEGAIQAVRQQAKFDTGLPITEQITSQISITLDNMSGADKIMYKSVDALFARILPDWVRTVAAHEVNIGDQPVQGVYQSYEKAKPLIIWSFKGDSPMSTGRHEAVHFLREYGFFTENEWETLRKAAIGGNWLEKHNINKRYEKLASTPEALIEEAIAEEYSKTWSRQPGNVQGAIGKIFEKLHMLLIELKESIQKALGKEVTPEQIFEMIESGEMKSRSGAERLPREMFEDPKAAAQGELDVTRQNDKAIFDKASAIGMTVPQYKRYLQLIEKRNLEDIQAQRERAIALEKKRQSSEWRQESEAIEADVRTDLKNRPDIAATEFFRYGELYGEKIDGARPKLDEALLTPEERKLLPQQWYGPKGMHPDDAANLFGYSSKAELVERIGQFEAARGNIRPGEFLSRLVKAEVERRMVEKYGELDSNILSAAEDHVLGVTQIDLLHEETLALGTRSGAEISFTKEDVQAWAETRFNEAQASKVSAVKFLDEAGKAGRAAELALLKGDFTEAFRQKQAQYLSALMAREAKGFEKETRRFDRLANRFQPREVKGIDPEFKVHIQALLKLAEYPVRLSEAEIMEGIQRAGAPHNRTDLRGLVESATMDGYDIMVQPSVVDGQIKPADKMTVEEARTFRSSVTSLNHVGREIQQIEIAGQKMDFDAWKENVIQNIKELPRVPKKQNPFLKWLYSWDSELTRMEEIVKDLDLRQEVGPLWDVLIRPMAEAKNVEFTMMEALAKKFNDMRVGSKEWQKTLDDTIPQNFFFDPDGTLFDISRKDMIGMMLNYGNKSNIEKFLTGWSKANKEDVAMFDQKLRTLFDQNATKADWDFVQNMWDMFDTWRKESNELYYALSGVPPKWIDAQEVVTPHGTYRGGYFPILYDKYWGNVAANDTKGVNPNAVFFNYHRSTPVNHYTKSRTGYVDFVEFQEGIDNVPMRMQQEIHDIAYRRALIAAKKAIGDKQIRSAIRQHYGPQYEAQLTPWLQKIASQFNENPEIKGFNGVFRRARANLVIHALGANLRVILSPDIGTLGGFGERLAGNWGASRELAMEKSKELPHTFHNMDRDFRERLEQTINAQGFDKFRADAMRWFFSPALWVTQQFRIATWNKEYSRRMAAGMAEGDAIAVADSHIRERHGAAGIADLPAIMTQNEGWKTLTMFYGFFNTMYNWQRQIPGALRRGDMPAAAKALWGAVILPSAFGALLFNQQKENDSWGKTIAKALVLQPLGTIPVVRDAASLTFEGFASRNPVASVMKAAYDAAGDIRKYAAGKRVEKPITHAGNVIGLGLGLPMAQVSRTAQFAYDVNTGKQRPRNIIEWSRGIISGEARLRK